MGNQNIWVLVLTKIWALLSYSWKLCCFLNDDLQVLSMSRLGAAEAVVPLITDGQAEVLLFPSVNE